MVTRLPSPETVPLQRKRPASVERLGLSLPVTENDVKQAYFREAQAAHPDHGGAVSDFLEVQRAFDDAVEYAKRNSKRLPWLGAQVPVYLAQREAIELVDAWGGGFTVESLEWLEGTVGEDFAQVADRLTSINLSGLPIGDQELDRLTADARHLPYLERIDLSDTRVTDLGAALLTRLPSLRWLDLRGAGVTFAARRRLAKAPGVERVEGLSRLSEWFHSGHEGTTRQRRLRGQIGSAATFTSQSSLQKP